MVTAPFHVPHRALYYYVGPTLIGLGNGFAPYEANEE